MEFENTLIHRHTLCLLLWLSCAETTRPEHTYTHAADHTQSYARGFIVTCHMLCVMCHMLLLQETAIDYHKVKKDVKETNEKAKQPQLNTSA